MNKWFFVTISVLVYIFWFFPLEVSASFGVQIDGFGSYVSPNKGCETNTIKNGEACLWEDGTSWCGNNTNTCQVEPTGAAPVTQNGSFSFSCNSCSYELSCSNGYEACASTNSCIFVLACDAEKVFDACSNSCILAPSVSLNYDTNNPVLYLTKNRFVGLGTNTPNRQFHIFNTSINPEINLQSTAGANMHWGIYNDIASNTLRFWGGSDWLTILRNGNVGIGTTAPNSLLHLLKTSGDNAELDIQSVAGVNKHWGIYQDRLSGSLRFWNNTPATEKNVLTILESGNVGIGTTAPDFLLHLYNTSVNPEIALQGVVGNNQHWKMYNKANGNNNSLQFWGGEDWLTILRNGNVGISSSTPNYKLDVNGTINASAILVNGSPVGVGGSQWTTSSNNIYYNLGNVGIGSSTPNYKLDVNGTINATNILINGSAISGGGITSLNGLTGATQTFAVGTSGTNFNIQSSSTIHTFNIPLASASNSGLLSNIDWGKFNDKVSSQWTNNGNDIYYNNGKVGVGLTNPGYQLHLSHASSGPIIGLTGLNTNYRGLTIKDTLNNEKWFYGNNGSNNFVIRRGGASDDLTINGAGNMGIGTSTINSKLVVDGLIKMNVSNALITSPEDVINKSYLDSVLSVSSGAGKFVGVTTNSYAGNNGAAGTGYKKANGLCNSSFSGSHVCTTYEILNTIISSSTMPTTGMFWIFNGPPAYTASANDCEGRTSVLSSSYGAIWSMGPLYPEGRGMLTACSNSNQFACCK